MIIQNIIFGTPKTHSCKNSTQHNSSTPTTTMGRGRPNITMVFPKNQTNSANKPSGGSRDYQQQKKQGPTICPPPVVETVVSSSQSQTSSIGIGEFGMNPARRGNAAAFSMAIKDNLFPKLKFLQGTNASLDFSMDATSICGYLRICCGVSEDDASQWWDDHRMLVKNIHTDCRNNKIKMIKQQFNGKYIENVMVLYDKLR
jgi:hypothetical protein